MAHNYKVGTAVWQLRTRQRRSISYRPPLAEFSMIDKKHRSWRKRQSLEEADRNPTSKVYRRIRDLVQNRRYEQALELIDHSIQPEAKPLALSKLASLVGDVYSQQGKIRDAIESYSASSSHCQDHPRQWFRPSLSEVKLLLRQGESQEAFELARRSVARALREERLFKKLVRTLERQLETTGEFHVVQRPYRPSVVSTRLGHLFLMEGELDAAEFLFEKVIQVNPNGGCRARLGMAEICRRRGNFQQARSWAIDGIVNGKYQGKTLSGWKILVRASHALEGYGLPEEQKTWLRANFGSPIGKRAVLEVVKELRHVDDPFWTHLTYEWLNSAYAHSAPAMECELRKILLAESRIVKSGDEQILDNARRLWNVADLSLRERISAMRCIVDCSLKISTDVKPLRLVVQIGRQFGKEGRDRAAHAVAELYFENGKREEAIRLLTTIIHSVPVGSKRWGRSTWRLAKYLKREERYEESAKRFLSIARTRKTPDRIRAFALVEAMRLSVRVPESDIIPLAKPYLSTALTLIDDPFLLMDISRQLGSAPDSHELFAQYKKKGETSVLALIQAEEDPTKVSNYLFQYCRRQYDWGDLDAVTAYWENMGEARRLWLWTAHQPFWEYVALVMRAYAWTGHFDEAEAIARQYLDDPATTDDGYANIGIPFASLLIENGNLQVGFDLFQSISKRAPTHQMSGYAYYWFSLRALSVQDWPACLKYCIKIRSCLNNRSKIGWIKHLRDSADILQHCAEMQRSPEALEVDLKLKKTHNRLKEDYKLLTSPD